MCNSSKPRILYVDDDQDACEMVDLMLRLEIPDCEVTAVTTAVEALSLMTNEPVSLFIFDYALPKISGVELCRLIRQQDSQTPIMFYSAMAREIDRRQAFEEGATAYLVKPNDLDIFTETVRRLLPGNSSTLENEVSTIREPSYSGR